MAQIFLSYGHRDTKLLAERLCLELRESGYDVWQDAERIRAGWVWTEEIRQGLRSSQVLISLLSPHAVRRTGMAGNPDNKDSVCLDEIAYAVDALNIPVVPVMAITCEPPFRIFRLQYLDFRKWNESTEVYDSLFQQLRWTLDEAIAHKTSAVREWGWLPEPWDFGSFLAEKRRDFTGREWLLEKIEDWRTKDTSPALLITGAPGVGKSAVVADSFMRIQAARCSPTTAVRRILPRR
jgi:hypothetical protein